MRGDIYPQPPMFSFIDLESRIPQQYPIRKIRRIVDEALVELAPRFDEMYATGGRPSIPPELLIQDFSVTDFLYHSLGTPISRAYRL